MHWRALTSVIILALGLPGAGFAQEAANARPVPVIEVGATASVARDNNAFQLRASVEGRGDTAADALREAAAKHTTIREALDNFQPRPDMEFGSSRPIIESVGPGCDIDTSFSDRDQPCRPRSYVATIEIVLSVEGTASAGPLYTFLTERGARVDPPSFYFTQAQAVTLELRTAALRIAERSAMEGAASLRCTGIRPLAVRFGREIASDLETEAIVVTGSRRTPREPLPLDRASFELLLQPGTSSFSETANIRYELICPVIQITPANPTAG